MVKFTSDWLNKPDGFNNIVSDWGRPVKNKDVIEVYCFICTSTIQVGAKGFHALLQHAKTAKHKEQAKIKLCAKQLKLGSTTVSNIGQSSTSTTASTINKNYSLCFQPADAATKAELVWCLKTVVNDFSLNSCAHIKECFHAMFSDGVPQTFSMSRDKARYLITEALGPYFKEKLCGDARNSLYCLQYDETTNSEGKQ